MVERQKAEGPDRSPGKTGDTGDHIAENVLMGEHDSLRGAGGTRSINDGGQVLMSYLIPDGRKPVQVGRRGHCQQLFPVPGMGYMLVGIDLPQAGYFFS